MRFIKEGPDSAVAAVVDRLAEQLHKKHPVIWLVCGGSNIATEVQIMGQLRRICPGDLGSLLILPMDERYGASGHEDSNYRQMKDAGFDPGDAMWIDVLAQDLPLVETVDYYSGVVQAAFEAAAHIVGVFGLGTDGHTAGVLPRTPAVRETATSVVGYESPPYVRLTLTPPELIKTTVAFVLAYGDTKREPLTRLQHNVEKLDSLPSKLLYDIADVFVYNDQIESEG